MADAIPTIPIPQGDTERLPTPYRQGPAAPDASGLAQGLMQLGAGLEKHAQEVDAVAAQEAETAYAETILKKVHGTVDKDTGQPIPGFASLQGHEALDASTQVTEDLRHERERIASNLANDRQRRIFLGRTQADFLGAQRAVEGHVGRQIEYLKKQGFDTRMEAATKTATAVYADAVLREEQLRHMGPWLDLAAEDRGLRGNDAERWKAAERGKVVTAVLQRLLEDEGRARDAKAWLTAHRGDLDEKDAFRFGKMVEAADLRDRGATEADQLWARAEGDPAKAVAAVRQIKEIPLRDEVDRRVKQRVAEDQAVQRAADGPREARLEVGIYQGRGLNRLSPDYQALSDEGRARVESKVRAMARADTTEQRDRDRELFYLFKSLPLKGTDGADQVSVSVDQEGAFADATPTMRQRIRAEQQRARGEFQKDSGVDRGKFLNQVDALSDRLRQPGKRTNLGSLRGQFSHYVEQKYDEWLLAHPTQKTVPPEEVAKIFAEALRYREGAWYQPSQYAWQQRNQKMLDEFLKRSEGPSQPGLEAVEKVTGLRVRGQGSAPARPAAPAKVYRRVDPATGEARVWNGSAWVPEGTR